MLVSSSTFACSAFVSERSAELGVSPFSSAELIFAVCALSSALSEVISDPTSRSLRHCKPVNADQAEAAYTRAITVG